MEIQIYNNFLNDLKTANTIGFFEMRERKIKEMGGELPKNIEKLRKSAVENNIGKLEDDIASANHEEYKKMRQDELDEIKTNYKGLLE